MLVAGLTWPRNAKTVSNIQKRYTRHAFKRFGRENKRIFSTGKVKLFERQGHKQFAANVWVKPRLVQLNNSRNSLAICGNT